MHSESQKSSIPMAELVLTKKEGLGYFHVVSEPPEVTYHLLRLFEIFPEEQLARGTDRDAETSYLAWQAVRHINEEKRAGSPDSNPTLSGKA